MAKPRKITQNINKDVGLLDIPKVNPSHSTWETRWSNYLTMNIGEIVPIYVDEILPNERRKITMGQLSHMTTPKAPIFNAQYTEFRSFWVPYRLCADLLAGYKTRKSPWVKVFGEDNASSNAEIIVPLADQKLPSVSGNLASDFITKVRASTFGGLADSLGYEFDNDITNAIFSKFNFLDLAAYELVYQTKYRNQNRESATNSGLYKWLFDLYNRTSSATIQYDDSFHLASREKDYFTGASPFTQKGDPVSVGLVGDATVSAIDNANALQFGVNSGTPNNNLRTYTSTGLDGNRLDGVSSLPNGGYVTDIVGLKADLSSATGVNIEQLRIMIKTQELLEKDMLYGNDYISSLNSHFGTAPISTEIGEPLELKKVTITSTMQAVLQTSSTADETSILGSIGANATTQSDSFEIVPYHEFKEHGLLIICAVHKAQNSYDSMIYKPKRLFKQARFDFYTPELNDLGYQKVSGYEFGTGTTAAKLDQAVGFNEAFAEYRYKFNQVHGMFEPSRSGALDFWTLSLSKYADVQSLYKQSVTELNRAISVESSVAPQFFDAYGFIEINSKPMSLHSIPGMDGVI